MPLVIHSPHAAMGGEQVIRISNEDRPTRWITFHFESEAEHEEDARRFLDEMRERLRARPKRISCCATL